MGSFRNGVGAELELLCAFSASALLNDPCKHGKLKPNGKPREGASDVCAVVEGTWRNPAEGHRIRIDCDKWTFCLGASTEEGNSLSIKFVVYRWGVNLHLIFN